MIKRSLVILLLGIFVFSVVSSESFETKIDFEITGFEGIDKLDNMDGHMNISIWDSSGNLIDWRSAVVGVYLENMTITMSGERISLNYSTSYTYNLSCVYGDFLFNFTTPKMNAKSIVETWNDSKDYFVQLNTTEGNRTVLDERTDLIWQDGETLDYVTWTQAIDYCNGLNWGGFSDWRLPNYIEFVSVMNFSTTESNFWPLAFKTRNADYYWTSTTAPDSFNAYNAYMLYGYINYDYKDDDYNRARCVRDQ